jgi:hypothetical protein
VHPVLGDRAPAREVRDEWRTDREQYERADHRSRDHSHPVATQTVPGQIQLAPTCERTLATVICARVVWATNVCATDPTGQLVGLSHRFVMS